MVNFERISLEQLVALCKVIHSSSSLNIRTIRRWYESESINFSDTLEFFLTLGIVNVEHGVIRPDISLREVLGSGDESIRVYFLNLLFLKNNKLRNYLHDYFDRFELSGNFYKITPTIHERLKYSGVRNFLISLGALQFDARTNSYYIRKELIAKYQRENKTLSYQEFEKLLKLEQELGFTAEQKVYKYEINIFIKRPDVQKNIRHTSLEEVEAGYDITSFKKANRKTMTPKYIEVKAVSNDNWKFYWSRNEINKAMQLKESYYLYLLPTKKGKISKPMEWRQIKNPYKEIFQNKHIWNQEIELISFSRAC